jgi:ribosomal protein S18 acetylase RimI-like enzyme
MFSALGLNGLKRYAAMTGRLLKMHKLVTPGPYWYLSIIVGDPAGQRKGLGAELLKPVLDKAKAAGVQCYLETSNEKSIPFYHKQGFEVAEEITVPGSDLRIWAMVKKPG